MDLIVQLQMVLYWVVFQFQMIFPYWVSGLLAGSLISVFLSGHITRLAAKLEGGRYGLLAIVPAALLGAASPICMYGTVPLIASLGRKGVPHHILVSFMISSILINPNLFIFSFSLGARMAFARLAACIAAGIVGGLLASVFFRRKPVYEFTGFEGGKKRAASSNLLLCLLSDINRAIQKTAPYFLIGILLAALFELYFPKDLIIGLFGANKGFGVLLAATLGIPVYVCGGGTIPLLRAWLQAGMSPGSAIAFMITGPATKITNLGAVKIILGARNFFVYLAFNIVFALITGIVIDIMWKM